MTEKQMMEGLWLLFCAECIAKEFVREHPDCLMDVTVTQLADSASKDPAFVERARATLRYHTVDRDVPRG